MTKIAFLFVAAPLCAALASAQVSVTLQDNWSPTDNSWTAIIPGAYHLADTDNDGLIRIVNKHNVRIDGDSVAVHGAGFAGYFIYIENSDSVTIRNFRAVDSMFYAVFARNSRHITITNCNFSNNKKTSVGYIDVWTDVDAALGGGVLMDSCRSSMVSSSVMKNSNDGVALYHCDSITVNDNDLSWNTSYGVRMYWANRCSIRSNNCSHTNRLTDQSDCGAVLMIVSNENRVEYNDLTYSGDGIFLGQYQYHMIPNNNYFAYNDGSYSPHNAFEATFASGNIFKHNRANHSDYGFWLGYSFNTLVDSNEINNNQTAGIAIDRGFQNTIRNNVLEGNPTGIWLWEGSPIPLYAAWGSHDYTIDRCLLTGNGVGLSASSTKDLMMGGDTIAYNLNGVHFDGSSTGNSLSGCIFGRNVLFHIENMSTDDIQAQNNAFGVNDTLIIGSKIYDKDDDPVRGTVHWLPFRIGPASVYQMVPPADLTEPPSVWTVYASDGRSTTAVWDSSDKQTEAASLKVITQSGFDVAIQYWPEGTSIASWDLGGKQFLTVNFKASNAHPFQENSIRLGNESGGYFQYDASAAILTSTIGSWKQFIVPLIGDATWQRTTHGVVSLSNISYVQLHADTWDAGFTLWIDGLSFGTVQNVVDEATIPREFALAQNSPNPFNPTTTIQYQLPVASDVMVNVHDILGREVAILVNEMKPPGIYKVTFDASGLSSGIYFYTLHSESFTATKKMVVLR